MEDWAAAAADVDAGMREAGVEVTLTQPATDGIFDPATETTTGASPGATHIAFGIQGKPYTAFSIGSGSIEDGDVRLLLSTLKTNGQPLPKPVADSWTALWAGRVHTVKQVETTQPGGAPVMYELRLTA